MRSIEDKVQRLLGDDGIQSGTDSTLEWESLLEEKASTQRGLALCAQLSVQIEQFELTSQESPEYTGRPSAHKYMRSGLDSAKGSIQSVVTRLQTHEDDVDRQLKAITSVSPLPKDAVKQLIQLQQTKDSLRQCIKVVSDAGETLTEQRRNVFEDITMADDSYDFSVSTVGDLVTARRFTLRGRSRHIGGQLSDESYQRTIDAITRLDMEHIQRIPSPNQGSDRALFIAENENTKPFSDRHGRGVALSRSAEQRSGSKSP